MPELQTLQIKNTITVKYIICVKLYINFVMFVIFNEKCLLNILQGTFTTFNFVIFCLNFVIFISKFVIY